MGYLPLDKAWTILCNLLAFVGVVTIKKIGSTSTQSWAHINLVGEYDFSDEKGYKTFDLNQLMELILKREN